MLRTPAPLKGALGTMDKSPAPLPLRVTFDNVLADHLAAERLYYRSTVFWKLDKVVGALLIGLGVCFIYFVGLVWWAAIWIPLGVLETFNLLSLRPIQVRLWFKHNPKFRETYNLSIDEPGISFRTATIDSQLKWDNYSRLLENESLYLLIYGSRMYTVIPKRAFHSASELDTFRSLVSSKIGVKPHGA